MARLKDKFLNEVAPAMMEKFGYKQRDGNSQS